LATKINKTNAENILDFTIWYAKISVKKGVVEIRSILHGKW
jgi:hypothetical protein